MEEFGTVILENETIIIDHNAGFFSCCSVRLHCIIEYINLNKKVPIHVDSSKQFEWYKKNILDDITLECFKNYNDVNNNIEIDKNDNIDYNHNHQFIWYNKLDYQKICPVVEKYFSPSYNICSIIAEIENKFSLDYDNTCVLFYRGNDKERETKLSNYNDYVKFANEIMQSNPNIRFLIQSDETEFIEYF